MHSVQPMSLPNQQLDIAISPPKLSNLEMFGLASSILGLFVDLIALVTFIAGIWSFNMNDQLTPGKIIFLMLSGFIVVYGWFVLSWLAARRGLNHIPNEETRRLATEGVVLKSTASIGVLNIPLLLAWLMAVDPSGVAIGVFIFLGLVICPLVCFGVAFSLSTIMQLVYSDLTPEPKLDDIGTLKKDLEQNWPQWEKRIEVELDRSSWVSVWSVEDMANNLQIPVDCLELAFAKYVSLHPEEVEYGHLYKFGDISSEDKQCGPLKVLASINSDLGERGFAVI